LEFFNKPAHNAGLQAIHWDEWENSLHTSGIVSKIKGKYEAFMKAEYNVDAAVG
jgi:hypothetical protein